MKYTKAEKHRAVLSVVESGLSVYDVAKTLGASHGLIQHWVGLYHHHGLSGLSMKAGSYSGEYKLSVLTYMQENHLSLRQTAAKFGIPAKSTVERWFDIYSKEGAAGLCRNDRGKMKKPKPPKIPQDATSNDALLKELEYLRAENAYLKKLRALVEERIARESGKEPKPSKH